LETILLFESGRMAAALAYVVGSVLFGALALWAGLALVRSLT
jgi:fluoride ion exporter CrcB/FEX